MRGDVQGGSWNPDDGVGRLVLFVHDPDVCDRIGPGFARYGFTVRAAHSAAQALQFAAADAPAYAVIALRLGNLSGLRLIPALRGLVPAMRIVVLTAYPSIETAVEAIKLGAVHYLVTPASPERILDALLHERGNPDMVVREYPMSMKRVAWEYVHHVLQEHDGNISGAARALGIDRRTLQRKLRKHPVAT